MDGDELEQTAPGALPAPSLVDRDLVARDLERAGSLLTPLMMANLSTLRTWRPRIGPVRVPVGQALHDRLRVYLPPMISGALGAVQTLSDSELRGLCAVIAAELGAWCRAAPPLTDEQLREAGPALAHLLGTTEDRPPVDWSELEQAMHEGGQA